MEVDGDLKPLTVVSSFQWCLTSLLDTCPFQEIQLTQKSVGKYTDTLSVYLLYINVSAPIASYKSCLSSYDGGKC